jgi:hypothetical protein
VLKANDIDIEQLVRSNIQAKLRDAQRNSQTSLDFYKQDDDRNLRSFDNRKSPTVFERLSTITRVASKREPIRLKNKLNNQSMESSPTLFDWRREPKPSFNPYQSNSMAELTNERPDRGMASVINVNKDVRLKKYNVTMNKFHQSQPKLPKRSDSVEQLEVELQQLQDMAKAM